MRLLVLLFAVACLAGSLLLTVDAIVGGEVAGSRFQVPGEATVTLEAKTYNLWTRFEDVGVDVGGRGCNENARELQIASGATLRGPGGQIAPEPRTACGTVSSGDTARVSTVNFDVPVAGRYRFTALGALPAGTTETWLSPGRNLVIDIGGPLLLFLLALFALLYRFTALRRPRGDL